MELLFIAEFSKLSHLDENFISEPVFFSVEHETKAPVNIIINARIIICKKLLPSG